MGIIGRIGSGKSTAAQLVPRLFDASSGEVLLDGQDVRKLSLRDLRAQGVEPAALLEDLDAVVAIGRRPYDSFASGGCTTVELAFDHLRHTVTITTSGAAPAGC